MEEMAQSVKELSNMSESMLQIVKQFKLVKDQD
jgi:methyl-accepting chemotaxis protein